MKQGKILTILLPTIFFLTCLVSPVVAETKTLNVTKDTYANKAYPDKVNGTFGSITISNKFTDRLGFLQFDNPSLPTEAVIDSAVLKIYLHELLYADTAKLNVGPVTSDWTESGSTGLTWNNKPTIDQSQAIEATISLTDSGWKEINVTSLVQKWVNGSLENKGLFVYPFGFLYGTAESEFAFSFKSREAGENPARIEIEYHLEEPAPTSEPETTPTLAPETSPAEEATISPIVEETPPPTEETPSSSEATDEAGTVLRLNTGQLVIIGLIFLALIGALFAFIVYFRKAGQKEEKPAKKKKKAKEKEVEKEEKKAEEEEI